MTVVNYKTEEEAAEWIIFKISESNRDSFNELSSIISESNEVGFHCGVIMSWRGMCAHLLENPMNCNVFTALKKSVTVISHKYQISSCHSGTHNRVSWMWLALKESTKLSIWITSFITLLIANSNTTSNDCEILQTTIADGAEMILFLVEHMFDFLNVEILITHMISCIISLQAILIPGRLSCITRQLSLKPSERVASTPLVVFSSLSELTIHLQSGLLSCDRDIAGSGSRKNFGKCDKIFKNKIKFTRGSIKSEQLQQLLVEVMLCSSDSQLVIKHALRTVVDFLPTDELLASDLSQWLPHAMEMAGKGQIALCPSIRIVIDFFISADWAFCILETAVAASPEVGNDLKATLAALICGIALPLSRGFSVEDSSSLLCRAMSLLVLSGQLPHSLASVFVILEELPRSAWPAPLSIVVKYLISSSPERDILLNDSSITNLVVQNPVKLTPITSQPPTSHKRSLSDEGTYEVKKLKEEIQSTDTS